MPRREGPHIAIEALDAEARALIPSGSQAHWYRHVGSMARYLSVLDVGAGDGAGMAILRDAGCGVRGIDPGPACAEVERATVWDVDAGSCDIACAMDVIEHVEDDATFLVGLLRVARRGVFFSTPNYRWEYARLGNPHHVREYTPRELSELLEDFDCDFWMSGVDLVPVRIPDLWYADEHPNFGVWIHHRGRVW